jgi:peptidoglycan/xylan/chitin deacetylase (PgdA/CDA1 family)
MEVGSHGDRHFWLGRLTPEQQALDIDRSLTFLSTLGLAKPDFWFCYPYGSYNADTIRLLKERNCGAAVSTVVDIANCQADLAHELARLDTNDIPFTRDSEVSAWTKKMDNQEVVLGMEKV